MPGEKGGKGPGLGPEHGPVVRMHATVERLVDVGPGLPPETRARIAALTKALESYEDFADTFGKGEIEDKIALIEILEQCQVFSPEFLQQFESVGRLIHAMHDKAEKRLHAAVTMHGKPPGLPVAPEIRKAEKEHQKLVSDADRTMGSILSRLQGDHRPLANAVMTEAITASFIRSLEKNIKRNGVAQVMADYAPDGIPMDDNERVHGQRHLAWIRHAATGASLKDADYHPGPSDFTTEEKLQLLREAEFMPSDPIGYRLPFTAANGEPGILTIQIHPAANAFTLASFAIRVGKTRVFGSFSRLTGQLHPPHCMLLTLEEEFRFANAKNYYQLLRDMIIRALFTAWEAGKLKEKEYLVIDPIAEAESEEPPAHEEEPVVQEEPTEENVTEINAAQEEPPIVHSQEASATTTVEKKKRPGKISYTWRRVMRALERYGVKIETEHAHPRLIFEGKTTRYLNSSETDSRYIREQLFNALKELGIPREEFKKKLY